MHNTQNQLQQQPAQHEKHQLSVGLACSEREIEEAKRLRVSAAPRPVCWRRRDASAMP